MPGEGYLHMFDGTPLTLTSIGDDVMLNAGSKIQCHSQEDGTFKSDRTTIGAGCTVGVSAMIHYGVMMADGSELAPDSFLMKGEELAPRAVGRQPGEGDVKRTACITCVHARSGHVGLDEEGHHVSHFCSAGFQ